MRVYYRQTAEDDIIRQFRYYLVTAAAPEVAIRFRDAVKRAVALLREHPFAGPLCSLRNPRLKGLRSWPVSGFAPVRIYYLPEPGALHVIRILHQKRDVRRLLEQDPGQ